MTVELGNRNGLDDREALAGALVQIPIGVFAVEPMKQLPGGITQVEEGRAVFLHQEALVLADLEPGQRGGSLSDGSPRQQEQAEDQAGAEPVCPVMDGHGVVPRWDGLIGRP